MVVWTREMLRAGGLGNAAVRRLARSGRLVRVGHDRYAEHGLMPSDVEVLAGAGLGAVLSHASAARARGWPIDDDRMHVTVGNGGARRAASRRGVVVHQSRNARAEVLDGVAVTTAARTLADVARTLPLAVAIPVLDAGLRDGTTAAEVLAELPPRSPGRERVVDALAMADARAESPLESLLRLLLVTHGLPPDDVQHVVREHGRFVGRVDLWYDGVVVEADGFAFHSDRADYRADRRKGQAYARLGLLVLRFSWEDVVHRPDHVVQTVRTALTVRTAA